MCVFSWACWHDCKHLYPFSIDSVLIVCMRRVGTIDSSGHMRRTTNGFPYLLRDNEENNQHQGNFKHLKKR
jgi:hypothetical protein